MKFAVNVSPKLLKPQLHWRRRGEPVPPCQHWDLVSEAALLGNPREMVYWGNYCLHYKAPASRLKIPPYTAVCISFPSRQCREENTTLNSLPWQNIIRKLENSIFTNSWFANNVQFWKPALYLQTRSRRKDTRTYRPETWSDLQLWVEEQVSFSLTTAFLFDSVTQPLTGKVYVCLD